MRYSTLDLILSGTALFLLGLCAGVSIIAQRVQFTDVTSLVLAGSAIFSVMKWRREIEYKEEKTDRKNLIKLLKNLDSSSEMAMKHIGFPVEQLADAQTGKINFSEIAPFFLLNKIKAGNESLKKIEELHYEIESEITANKIVREHTKMNENIHMLLLKNSKLFEILEKSYLVTKDGWWTDQKDDSEIFEKLNEEINQAYQDYFKYYLKIEVALGIFENTLSRHSSARKLGIL